MSSSRAIPWPASFPARPRCRRSRGASCRSTASVLDQKPRCCEREHRGDPKWSQRLLSAWPDSAVPTLPLTYHPPAMTGRSTSADPHLADGGIAGANTNSPMHREQHGIQASPPPAIPAHCPATMPRSSVDSRHIDSHRIGPFRARAQESRKVCTRESEEHQTILDFRLPAPTRSTSCCRIRRRASSRADSKPPRVASTAPGPTCRRLRTSTHPRHEEAVPRSPPDREHPTCSCRHRRRCDSDSAPRAEVRRCAARLRSPPDERKAATSVAMGTVHRGSGSGSGRNLEGVPYNPN